MWRKKKELVVEGRTTTVDRLREAVQGDRRSRWNGESQDADHLPPAPRPLTDFPEVQEEALAQMESVQAQPDRKASHPSWEQHQYLEERVRALRETCHRLEQGVDQLRAEVRGLAASASKPATTEPARSMARLQDERPQEVRPAAPPEPAFAAPGKPIKLVVTNVSDFQCLMDMQRALSALPEANGASVTEFENGQASFELDLVGPTTPGEVLRGLQRISGRRLLIEEARPADRYMRICYFESEAERPIAALNPRRSPLT